MVVVVVRGDRPKEEERETGAKASAVVANKPRRAGASFILWEDSRVGDVKLYTMHARFLLNVLNVWG